ncbi:MAG TPA: cupin domain-containing protein [Stellaceae bacterium]|nr:cupin domain-containing protein [Stellaceae bacterium]
MSRPRTLAIPTSEHKELGPAPISPDWIISGNPEAFYKELAKSLDKTSLFFTWDCTSGVFQWHYDHDETFVITAGEAFITGEDGIERRLGPGDMAYCPTGSSCAWRVPRRVKKIAMLRRSLPTPLSFAMRAWHRLSQMIGRRARSPSGFAGMLSEANRVRLGTWVVMSISLCAG